MSSKLQLNCLIWGDYSLDVFEITIERTEPVSSLKDAIKTSQSPRLDGFNPQHILLYQIDSTVSIPLNDFDFDANKEFESAVCQALDRKSHLRDKQTLSDVFSAELSNDKLHVVLSFRSFVPAPPTTTMTLLCVVRSESVELKDIFSITVYRRVPGVALRYGINAQRSFALGENLVLWSVRIPTDSSFEESIKNFDSLNRKPILPGDSMAIYFPVPPQEKCLHIVVEIPEIPESSYGRSIPATTLPLGQPIDVKRREFLRSNPPQAPSSQAYPYGLLRRQDDKQRKILCGRPRDAISVKSPTLLCQDFGQFLDDCQTCEGTADDNKFVVELSVIMSQFYQFEADRAAHIRVHFINWGLNLNVTSMVAGNCKTDGDLRIGPYRYAIMEVRNEAGIGGGDPYTQAGFSYLELTRDIATKRHDSVLPCFIINIFGPYLCISGATWTDRPTMQVLSTALPLHFHPTDTKMQSVIVRHLCSLKKALKSLQQHYQNLSESSSIPRPPIRNDCFPYPTEFVRRSDGAMQAFGYKAQLSDDKLLFSVTLAGTNTEVCIKFAKTYSEETHSFCASNGFAPALHGSQRLPGGWFMIVMDILDNSYVDLGGCQYPVPPQLFDRIEERLIEMHQHGYVHGDVRGTNIMVPKQDKASCSFMLVDFDWAGKIGEARYPLNVNREGVARPEGVEDGKFIMADHDIAMLAYMRPDTEHSDIH